MADQDQEPQGAIPPKVTPFAKPEGASPVTPVVPGAPRPITVRLRPAMPPSAGAQAAAPAAPAVGIPTPPSANPRSTARVPVPEAAAAAPASAVTPATVRLRPVTVPGAAPVLPSRTFTAPGSTQPITAVQTGSPATGATQTITPVNVVSPASGSTQPIAPMNPPTAATISPLHPQHPPTPGSNPLPEGPKPPSGAQVQAAKSKTSRISLDSAIGVAPMAPMSGDKSEPKTIRLKRPTDLAAPTATAKAGTAAVRQTSRIPDSALPTVAEAAAQADSSSVTQKKTLKIKRPGAKEEGDAAGAAGVSGEAFAEGVQMTPISALEQSAKPESSVFTAIAVVAASAAAVVLLLLTLCLGAHAVGPNAGWNSLASIKLGSVELPWGGRLN